MIGVPGKGHPKHPTHPNPEICCWAPSLEAVQQGPVNIAAEISKQVDECPSNGYLLDSSIQVPKRFVLFFRQQLQLLGLLIAFHVQLCQGSEPCPPGELSCLQRCCIVGAGQGVGG